MPDLSTNLHLTMLTDARDQGVIDQVGVYGLHWGDPQKAPFLRPIRDRFVLPYVHPDKTAIEVGSGGGRWTRYLLGFGTLYSFDYHQELLDELAKSYRAPHLVLTKNNGSDFPGIANDSIDFVFSFGVFVHLDIEIIRGYFTEIKRVLKPTGCAVTQYSDTTKAESRINERGFAATNPDMIRAEVKALGMRVLEEDLDTLPHSSVIRFAK